MHSRYRNGGLFALPSPSPSLLLRIIIVLTHCLQGVKQVANHPTFPRPRFLFLSPPSPEILEQRLRGRGTDKEEAILKRLEQAKKEMEFAKSEEAPHDKIVVNDDLEKAYKEVRDFIVG